MLNIEITEVLSKTLQKQERAPDGKLHPSGDLIGSLRHAQLRAAGAPRTENELLSSVRLMTGTLWHSYFESVFKDAHMPVMTEVKLDPWLPEGWSGTADWLIWNADRKAFVLNDLKTIKSEGMRYIKANGAKPEHLWQASAYFWAAAEMGIPLVKGIGIYYLPLNPLTDDPDLAPLYVELNPLPREQIWTRMEERWEFTRIYLASLDSEEGTKSFEDYWITPQLAPPQERVQALRWNIPMNVWDVKLVPHWSATYCSFPSELCDCNEQKVEKIGHYQHLPACTTPFGYVPRKGYEDVEVTVQLTAKELKKWQ